MVGQDTRSRSRSGSIGDPDGGQIEKHGGGRTKDRPDVTGGSTND